MPETEGAGGEAGHRQGADGGVHEVRQQFEPQLHQGELMSKVYDCLLPPLPMPFSEFCNSPTTMLSSHFSRVLEVEMAGLRYKGGPLPEKILEWFK